MYDLKSDYSSGGSWSGFQQSNRNNYGEYDQNPDNSNRARANTNRYESQGFWDDPYNKSTGFEKRDEYDPFEEFFFTNKKSAQPNYKDDTKGKDIKINIEVDFLQAIRESHTIKLEIVKDIVWKICSGTRCDPDSGPNVWAECGGRGFLLTNFGLK